MFFLFFFCLVHALHSFWLKSFLAKNLLVELPNLNVYNQLFICSLPIDILHYIFFTKFRNVIWADITVMQTFSEGPWILGICQSSNKRVRIHDGANSLYPSGYSSLVPICSEFQTRLLFNQAFSRGLQIQHILAGENKNK